MQSLAVAGGSATISAIADYTATGNVTYHWANDVQGAVTIQGMGFEDIRIDATLPNGVRSEAVHSGQTTVKDTDGNISQFPPTYALPRSEAFTYKTPMVPSSVAFPYLEFTAVLNDPRVSLSYDGLVQVDGRSVQQIEARRVFSARAAAMDEYHVSDYFIDASTLQIVLIRDVIPVHAVHEIRYADYRVVNGALMPSSISEQIGGQPTWDMQLSQFSFNTGLQDSGFVIQ